MFCCLLYRSRAADSFHILHYHAHGQHAELSYVRVCLRARPGGEHDIIVWASYYIYILSLRHCIMMSDVSKTVDVRQ